jgi:ESCRT-II complex subunit VPS36
VCVKQFDLALISPGDLYSTCLELSNMNLAFKFREFESGLRIMHSLEYSDSACNQRITDTLSSINGGISELEFAKLHRISVTLAKEQFLVAEKLGICCRDESAHGRTFYKNLFL